MSAQPRYDILKRNLYENCCVRNMQGVIIFYCSLKRANWYLKRNLAAKLNNDPLDIQLNFETKGQGHLGDDFYLQHRKNICTVCGIGKDLTRHHIIPICYRRHMNPEVKDHSFHDILLLCYICHDTYERYADSFKLELSKEYNAPLNGIYDNKKFNSLMSVRADANSLIKHWDFIPNDRKNILINRMKKTLNTDKIDLQSLSEINVEAFEVKTHGKIVVGRLTNLQIFLQRWRRHFLESMSPKFLPEFWSITRENR